MVTIKEFTCERCGNKFETTAKHAKYCPECREIKKLERIQAHKEKQKAGTARRVGTEQICPNCGKSFILKSGSQKICEECAKKRVYPKNSTVKPKDLYESLLPPSGSHPVGPDASGLKRRGTSSTHQRYSCDHRERQSRSLR